MLQEEKRSEALAWPQPQPQPQRPYELHKKGGRGQAVRGEGVLISCQRSVEFPVVGPGFQSELSTRRLSSSYTCNVLVICVTKDVRHTIRQKKTSRKFHGMPGSSAATKIPARPSTECMEVRTGFLCEQRNGNQTVATVGGNTKNSYRRKMTGPGMRKGTREREEVER